jgi:hypothetical protein
MTGRFEYGFAQGYEAKMKAHLTEEGPLTARILSALQLTAETSRQLNDRTIANVSKNKQDDLGNGRAKLQIPRRYVPKALSSVVGLDRFVDFPLSASMNLDSSAGLSSHVRNPSEDQNMRQDKAQSRLGPLKPTSALTSSDTDPLSLSSDDQEDDALSGRRFIGLSDLQ